ncbi:MAG: hypothetical protein ACTSR2_03925, partial [Candidatus Hodarchaeales archaeon]
MDKVDSLQKVTRDIWEYYSKIKSINKQKCYSFFHLLFSSRNDLLKLSSNHNSYFYYGSLDDLALFVKVRSYHTTENINHLIQEKISSHNRFLFMVLDDDGIRLNIGERTGNQIKILHFPRGQIPTYFSSCF